MRRRRVLGMLGTGSVVALAGCNSGGDDTDNRSTGSSQLGSSALPQRTAKLRPKDGDTEEYFAGSVALSGDGSTAVIGAYWGTEPNGERAGAAYVFTESGGNWQQQTTFAPDDGDSGDLFGVSATVSNDGSTAIVGAQFDEDPNGKRAGSAYVFSRSGGSWQQQAKLAADDGGQEDLFGRSVGVSGDGSTVVVGAPGGRPGEDPGSAYVFSRSGGDWHQQTAFAPDDVAAFPGGLAVSGDGSTTILGAVGDNTSNGDNSGSAYVFRESGGRWHQQTTFSPDDGDTGNSFGNPITVSTDGSTAMIGAIRDSNQNGEDGGAAYVFTESDERWQQQAKLVLDGGDNDSFFGGPIGLSGDGRIALVGSTLIRKANSEEPGSVYLFTKSDGTWQQRTTLTPANNRDEDGFSSAVGVSPDGSTAIIGALAVGSDSAFTGTAYVFR